MSFWDTSALVPLITLEAGSEEVRALYRKDSAPVVWWATEVECVSAFARLERGRAMSAEEADKAIARLHDLGRQWTKIDPSPVIRDTAKRLLRTHALRAADAFQIAAALVAAEWQPSSLAFLTLDRRLAETARREGFDVPDLAE